VASVAEGVGTLARRKDAAGARPESQGASLGALAQAQLSGATRLVTDSAASAIERFADPALLASGKVTIVSVEAVQHKFADQWPAQRDQVFDFALRVLEKGLGPRGVFERVSDTDFFVIHTDLSRLACHAACLRYLREILTHFLGDDDAAAAGIRQVTQISRGRLQTCEVDALYAETLLAQGVHDEGAQRLAAFHEDSDIATRLVNRWTPFVATDGRRLRVSATLEPVYELKGFTRIGFRMIRRVIVIATTEELSPQAVASLSAGDILRADLATITRGIDRLKTEAPDERQLSLIVPISFTSLSSARGRAELVEPLKEASGLVKLGVVCEILDIEGVPPSALLSAATLVKPFSLLVAGRMANASAASLQRLRGAGLQALTFICPQGLGEAEFLGWATSTVASAKKTARSVLVYGVSTPQRAATLASLGATHVSLITQ
jgi:hypothetical protein